MKNKILDLAEKRERQSQLAKKIGKNQSRMKEMTDNEIRFYNLDKEEYSLSREVKDGVSFSDVYQFATEHYSKTKENIISEPINEVGHTLLWSGGHLEELIWYREMTKEQYSCFDKAVDMIKSGNFDDYWAVKRLKY